MNMATKEKHEKIDFLSAGSTVEVSSGKEGLKGAWYVAKILKSLKNRRDKFLIQYQNLASDKNPSELLTEIVGISFIRPLPPPPAPDQTYRQHDVVDAFHLNGWRKGVVCDVKILKGKKGESTSYSVVFENPFEKFQFLSVKLRFHFEWSNGKWVQQPKQKRMEGLKIDKEMEVEVNFDGENSQDVWFPAIVVEEVGFNSFLVERIRSGNEVDDDRMKETVDSFHIRPPPPKLEVQNFEIPELVEAFCDSSWKKGIIVATLTRGRYSVRVDSEKKEMQFSGSELRPHLVWRNGKWIGFREIPNQTQCEKQSAHVDDIARHSNVAASVTSSIAANSSDEEKSFCKRKSDAMARSKDESSAKKSTNNPSDIQKESIAFRPKDKDAEISPQNLLSHADEQKNVLKGTVSEMEIEDRASKETEFSFSTENKGDKGHGDQSLVKADSELTKKQEMPFAKSSPLWQHVDSLDAFRYLPQKPHFHPLFELNEATREGFAICHMVNFSNLVEKIPNLRPDTPRKVFESYLEALADLELHGFDVKTVVERIDKLLAIKTGQEQLNKQSEDIRIKLAQCHAEKEEIETEIDAIDEMKRALETTKAMKLSERVMKESEMEHLQLDVSRIREDISSKKLAFESSRAAAW